MSDQLNILVVQETDWLRNLPLQSHHIMEALSIRGHQVKVIDFPARTRSGTIMDLTRPRTFLHAYRTDPHSSIQLLRPGMINAFGIGRASSMLPQFKVILEQSLRWCDVIVLYSVPTNGLQTILSSKLSGKPVLFHSFDVLHRMTGHKLLQPPTWAIERLVYKSVDKVAVISGSLFQYMKKIGVPEGKIILLPPAVSVERFNPMISGGKFRDEIGIDRHDKVALFSGWLYEFSGLDSILISMKKLLEDVPEFKLVVCGDGPLLGKLQSMREELALQESVKLVGRRPFSQMPHIVASADICINPYLPEVRSNFAFPSKIAEYMAAGKAVIATDLPGTRSFLGDGSGAVLVPTWEFPSSLRKLLLDDETRFELGRASRKYCEETFSLNSVTNRFESILNGLALNSSQDFVGGKF